MKCDVSVLSGLPLDWAVAKCQGYFDHPGISYWESEPGVKHFLSMRASEEHVVEWTHSSTSWDSGVGNIIETNGITLSRTASGIWESYIRTSGPNEYYACSDLPLTSAMRTYVQMVVGPDIEIPDALLQYSGVGNE